MKSLVLLFILANTWLFSRVNTAGVASPGNVTFVNVSAQAEVSTGDLTLNAPSSPQTNDIWIAITKSGGGSGTLSGWNVIYSAGSLPLQAWWFRYEGSTPNLTVTRAAGATMLGAIATFRGGSRTNPINVVGTDSSGTDTTAEVLGLTTTVANCMVVAADGAGDDYTRTGTPSGFTKIFEDSTGGTQNCFIGTSGNPDASVAAYYRTQASPGTVYDATNTMSGSGFEWSSCMFAIQPQ